MVQRVRRVLGVRAAGHTGTLDPFATGLLIVLVGRATRLARFVEAQSKTYLATARLGIGTDTDDLTGRIIATADAAAVDEGHLREALSGFRGVQLQRPPEYSAKHVDGERSYQKARRGEAVQLDPVRVTVEQIELVAFRTPLVTFRAVVSTGTYVRALARDLGERLNVGAHLTSLRREAVGPLLVEQAVPLERLNVAALIPPRAVLGDIPTVELGSDEQDAVSHGRAVRATAGQAGSDAVALVAGGELVAIARNHEGWLRPTVVLQTS